MQSDFIRLPTDGTGKKVRHSIGTDILLSSFVESPNLYSRVYGSLSGASGVFTGLITNHDGTFSMFLSDITGVFTVGDILKNQAGTVTYATVASSVRDLYTPQVFLSDPDNPYYKQHVDKRGAALTTFPEGTPQFDSFGRMQVSQVQAVGEYNHVGEDLAGKYWTYTSGGGTVSYDINTSSIRFIAPTSGAIARRTTNQYHPYKPGTSQLIYMTITCSDTGKANVVREWGYFDDNNGLGFRLNGTQLEVFIRSDASGTVQELVIPQSEWSDNTLLDTTAANEFFLDVSKGNIYWIDFAWLGMGRVKFGVETPDGRRITCHRVENSNVNTHTYMRVPTLPLTWQIKNTGNSVDVTWMRMTCAAVLTESTDLLYHGKLIHTYPPEPITLTDSTTYVPFLSFKAKSLVNGKPNTIVGIHETFDWATIGDSPVHVAIFVLPNESYLTGVNWSDTIVPETMLWVDRSATAIRFDLLPNLKPIESFIAPTNSAARISLGDRMEKSFGLGGNLNVAEGDKPVFVFAAKVLKPATTVNFFYTKYWKEIR